MANLLQITHAFGRPMETIDRIRMATALYRALQNAKGTGQLKERGIRNAVAAAAEGYAFPTNLDRDPPIAGLAPASDQTFMLGALADEMAPDAFAEALAARAAKRLSH